MAEGRLLTPLGNATAVINWGVAGQAMAGETESGDLHLVKVIPTGVLVAVVDGLGHGAEAAAAARAAIATLQEHALESILELVGRCHGALAGTRGAVMSLAHFDHRAGAITWVGVGNVEGVLQHADPSSPSAREILVTRGGIVGRELPSLRPTAVPVFPGDTLLLATDGIKAGFADRRSDDALPQQWADQILANHSKGTDDALVLVARYLGVGP